MNFEEMKNLPEEEQKKLFSKLKSIRTKAKMVNFSALYKVGKATLARNSGLKLSEAAKLLKIYWTRNKAILDVENSLKIKEIGDQKWLLNPVSNFWYSLRNDKDKFSTLNQGTAVYAFDQWVYFVRKEGIKIALQMHDEILFNTLDKEKTTKSLDIAMDKVNDKLKLNIKVGCSIEYGNSYSTVH
jgi:DNA polymerase I-like protein with 3'-5' exonuclease and polymerase domains